MATLQDALVDAGLKDAEEYALEQARIKAEEETKRKAASEKAKQAASEQDTRFPDSSEAYIISDGSMCSNWNSLQDVPEELLSMSRCGALLQAMLMTPYSHKHIRLVLQRLTQKLPISPGLRHRISGLIYDAMHTKATLSVPVEPSLLEENKVCEVLLQSIEQTSFDALRPYGSIPGSVLADMRAARTPVDKLVAEEAFRYASQIAAALIVLYLVPSDSFFVIKSKLGKSDWRMYRESLRFSFSRIRIHVMRSKISEIVMLACG